MTKKQKIIVIRLTLAIILFITAFFIPCTEVQKLFVFLLPYLIVGYSVIFEALENILHGHVLDENFLMTVASVGAFAIGEYPEAVFVMLFYQIGELFESIAVGKSRQSITELMDLRPDYANVEANGEITKISPSELNVGDLFIVQPGEKIPLDGTVIEGRTSLNTSGLTGESVPRDIIEGDKVLSGCININGLIKVRADKPYEESTASKILKLVENCSSKQSKAEGFISSFAKYYTPTVVIGALLLAVIPSLLTGNWSVWVYRALSFFVISCPCAIVISVPLTFFAGIGCASKNGILVKGSVYLERMSSCKTAVFDKTGTLTEGTFKVVAIHPEQMNEENLLELATVAECYSNHPISNSLREAYKKSIDKSKVYKVTEFAGRGVCAVINGREVYVGNSKLMEEIGAKWHKCHLGGTIVHIAVKSESGNIVYEGHISVSDSIKQGASEALTELKNLGIQKTVMLTGDVKSSAAKTSEQLSIDEFYSELLPIDKVEYVEKLMLNMQQKNYLMFVGDGVNDAPVLSIADVGVAMGALGSDAAIESADVVIMDDDLRRLSLAVRISRRTIRIARQNIFFSLVAKLVILLLTSIGICFMWEAVFADVGVMILASLNAVRALNIGKYKKK